MSVSAPTRVPLRSRSVETALVALFAALAAIAASLANAAPTGTPVWDEVLKGALAAGVVVTASKAPRWSVIFMASVAAASFATVWAVGAWVALFIAIGSVLLDRRSRLIGAVAAGIAVQSVLRFPGAGFFGLQSVLAAVAVLPVIVSGYRYGTKRARRVTQWTMAAIAGLLAVIGVVGGLTLLNARSEVTQGVSAARRGLEAARAGDTETVADELDRAERLFAEASTRLSGVGARSLRLVPIASQHQRAVEKAVTQGRIVTVEAAGAVREADIRNLRFTAGELDLAALSQMAPRLRSTAVALDFAVREIRSARSPWLIPALESRIDELLDEVQQFQPDIELGATAAEVLPRMLGSERTQTYFVMFGTPAESRELGGFLGSWALLTFDQGRLELGESGRINELYDIAAASAVAPDVVSDWFLEMARPTQFPQNLPSSPDIAQVAEVSSQVLAGVTDGPIDGFVYADGHALIDLLELSGPVAIPFQDEALTSDNAFDFFFDAQYRISDGEERTELFHTLAQVASGVIAGISNQTLPGPEELGRVVGPAARGGHLQAVTFDDRTNEFLRSLKLLREFGRGETQDFVGLVQTNGLSNKIDLYLQRQLDYEVEVSDEGQVSATARVALQSNVPADAPLFALGAGETVGTNRVLLSLYSPLSLDRVTINGIRSDVRIASEFGMGRYLVEVTVPPNADPYIIEYSLTGSVSPDEPYSLEVWHQPLVNSDTVNVAVTGIHDDIQWSGTLIENLLLFEISDY